ncbi:hypothetical protein GGX14DRAFT_542927 [Mycena pura]|uniref:F-box domain-containing protein n=1 Tax=Mycena pura TaxID=153505 RepID=A0AAD6VIT5_9AGAR|nr:hypothetical protein GGX14DRAFT_542927 [Mycena pura]
MICLPSSLWREVFQLNWVIRPSNRIKLLKPRGSGLPNRKISHDRGFSVNRGFQIEYSMRRAERGKKPTGGDSRNKHGSPRSRLSDCTCPSPSVRFWAPESRALTPTGRPTGLVSPPKQTREGSFEADLARHPYTIQPVYPGPFQDILQVNSVKLLTTDGLEVLGTEVLGHGGAKRVLSRVKITDTKAKKSLHGMSSSSVLNVTTTESLKPAEKSTLPFELADLIIGHIQGDKDALASFSLVSRAWLHISRPYLFGSVTLRDHTYEDFLLVKASRLCTFIPSIRTLSICRPEKDKFSRTSFTEFISKLVGSSFPSLTCLRVFDAYCTNLSAGSLTTVIAVLHDITELDIQRTTFDTPHHLVALLARLPRLKKVTIQTEFVEGTGWLQTMPGMPPPPDPPRSLQVVQLHLEYLDHRPRSSILLEWLFKGPPTVRVLALGRVLREAMPAIGTYFRTLGPVLCDLELYLEGYVSSRNVETDLAPHLVCLTNITHLTLRIDVWVLQPKHWYAYLALLESLPREPTRLETLTIILSIDYVRWVDSLDWGRFHAAVRTRAQLRLLRFRVLSRYRAAEASVVEIRKRVASELAAMISIEVSAYGIWLLAKHQQVVHVQHSGNCLTRLQQLARRMPVTPVLNPKV